MSEPEGRGNGGRQLHPSSVLYRSLSRSVNVGSLFVVLGIVVGGGGGTDLAVLGGMVVLGVLVGILYEYAYYRRFRYELGADTFDVDSGVFSRREREVPLGRVQNVDVRQNVLQRALGVAAVHVETAGGGETEVTLQYVGEDEAARLQRTLRSGGRERAERDATESVEGDRDEEALLFEIRREELAILSVFTIDPGASILSTIGLSFASGFDPTTFLPIDLLESDLPGTGVVAILWALALFLLAAWVLSAALTFSRYYGFRLSRVGDELHYERGLLQRYSGTIPLEKVQTLSIRESIPYRWFGYAALAVETAGYAPGQSDSRGAESAVPLAARERVDELARSIEPFEDASLERAPTRARERYAVRYGLVACLVVGGGYALSRVTAVGGRWLLAGVLVFLLVPPAAHLKWASRGFHFGDRHFLARTGFWRRTTKVVPYYRVQSVVYQQTIFQRRRRLASVIADTASSAALFGRAATAYDLDADRASEVQRDLNDRLQERLLERKAARGVDRVLDAEGFTSPDESEPSAPERGGDSDTSDIEVPDDGEDSDADAREES